MDTEILGYNTDTLLAMLHNRVVEIKFYKANGDLRTMRGTLNEDLLPKSRKTLAQLEEQEEERELTHKLNPNLVTLWDVDANGWRSLHADRIKNVL